MTTSDNREVTKEEFWTFIMNLGVNVHPSLEGSYPWTSVFLTPNREEYGRIVTTRVEGEYPDKQTFFIRRR